MLLQGLELIPLRQIRDDRGAVYHMLRRSDTHFAGFGEVYFSLVNPGVVKAWKCHRRMTSQLAVPHGEILLVLCDGRHGSPTAGQVQQVRLGEDAYRLAVIPPGIWYGFQNRGTKPALLTNCASIEHDDTEVERRPDDSVEIPYTWERST